MIRQEQIEILNIDEMTNGLCTAGETCFKRGEFKEALELLLRCVRAPRNTSTKYSEAKSYYLLGLIYGYLGQEMLAKENLLKGLELSQASDYKGEVINCYLSLAFFHANLGDFDGAAGYLEQALPLIRVWKEIEQKEAADMEITCLAYQGLNYVKTGQLALSEGILKQVEALSEENCEQASVVPMLDLSLRIAHEKQDKTKFHKCLTRLLELPILEEITGLKAEQ